MAITNAQAQGLMLATLGSAAGAYLDDIAAFESTSSLSTALNFASGLVLSRDLSADADFVDNVLNNMGIADGTDAYTAATAWFLGADSGVAALGRAGAVDAAVQFLLALDASNETYGAIAESFRTTVDTAVTWSQGAGADVSDISALREEQGNVDTVAGATFTLTTGADTFLGVSGGDDVITGAAGTIGTSDVILDGSSTDSDTLTLLQTGATLASMGTVVNIENVDLNVDLVAAGFTITSAGGVSNSGLTINSVRAGGVDTATVSDIGSNTSVTAGTRIAALTVDTTGDRANLTVTGGTGATIVNGAANKLTTATVDASAGTTVDVEFAANSSNITVIGGSGAVDINDGAGVKTTGMTVDASGSTTVTIDVGAASSNINVTTGSGAVDINNGTNVKVTGLVVDASLAESTIDIDVGDGSSLTLTAGTDAGAITLDGDSVAATTDLGGVLILTADAADIAAGGITDFDNVTLTLNGTASTVALDNSVRDVSVSATAAAQTVTALTAAVAGTVALSGTKAITFEMDGEDVDGVTVTSSGEAAHVFKISTNDQTADIDLSGIATDITIQLGVALAASGTGEITLADGASVKASTIQTAALGFTSAAAESTATLDLTGVVHTGSFAFTNMGTVTVTASANSSTAATITVDSDASGTQGNIVLTGSKNIALASATDAASVDGSSMTGNVTATMSATLDNLTTGSGDDSITIYNGDFTVDAGTGDNTLVMTGVDISDNTVSVSGFDVVSLTTVDATVLNGQLTGTETITGTTGTLTFAGTAAANTIDLSGYTVGLTQSVDGDGLLKVNALGGADVIVGSAKNDAILGGTGDDTITSGAGQDHVTGGAGADTIDLTESTSVADYLVYASLSDGSAAGAVGGTFSGYDVVTGFDTTVDKVVFDSAYANNGAATTDIFTAKYVAAGTAATLAANDLSVDEIANVDAVTAYIADLVAATTITVVATQDDVLAVTFSGMTALYSFNDADSNGAIASTEIKLIGTVDDVLVAGDLIIT